MSVDKNIDIVLSERFLDIDYKTILTSFAVRLLSQLTDCKTGLRIVRTETPREDGPAYQIEIIIDGEKVLFRFEGDSEEECAASLCDALLCRYDVISKEPVNYGGFIN